MISSNRKRDMETETAWWKNPDRKCWDKETRSPVPGYDDLADIKPKPNLPRSTQIRMLTAACHECPVFKACRIDFLSTTADWEHYGIRAGIVGKR